MLAVKPLFGTGVFARQTLDAVEADPSERELVVVIRSCWFFAYFALD